MPGQIPTGDIHHLRLTVTDLERSRLFYTSLLGFDVAVEAPPADDPSAAEVFKVLFGGVVMIRGNLLMACGRWRRRGTVSTPTGWAWIT
jgi:glyoxylase I family protein